MVHSAITAALLASIHGFTSGINLVHGFSAPSFSGGVVIDICRSSLSHIEADAHGNQPPPRRRRCSALHSVNLDDSHRHDDDDGDCERRRTIIIDNININRSSINNNNNNNIINRNHFLSTLLLLPTFLATTSIIPNPSHALVKGNAPPPKMKPPSAYSSSSTVGGSGSQGSGNNGNNEGTKCRNVEECQEMAERAEAALMQREAEKAALGPKPQIANGRTRYLDVVAVVEEDGSGQGGSVVAEDTKKIAKMGDTVTVYYKVLKLGKRSYDGLSGEGTVVFSRGYALEDDEKVLGDKSFTFVLGDKRVIQALNDAVPGMMVGSTRRISVTPQSGWEKNIPSCDGGPGGKGAGGELRTDYVVVPTATMVEQEACFDKSKLPFPSTYAQERRMAQRFDQSLIMEVKLVNVVVS